jgi:hypothetical protein
MQIFKEKNNIDPSPSTTGWLKNPAKKEPYMRSFLQKYAN